MTSEVFTGGVYPIGELMRVHNSLQECLQRIEEEYPVQVNTAKAVHRRYMANCHGDGLEEPVISSEERDRLLDTYGLSTTREELEAFGDACTILLLLASFANRTNDPYRISSIAKGLDVPLTNSSNECI